MYPGNKDQKLKNYTYKTIKPITKQITVKRNPNVTHISTENHITHIHISN